MLHCSRTVARIALLVLLAAAWDAPADAATLTLWPGKFKASAPGNTACTITEAALSSSGSCFFSAPVNLPVGATLTSATVSWKGMQNSSVGAWVQRRWLGGDPQNIAGLAVSFLSFDVLSWALTPLQFTGTDPVIRSGYRYFVLLNLAGESGVGGLKITYTRAP